MLTHIKNDGIHRNCKKSNNFPERYATEEHVVCLLQSRCFAFVEVISPMLKNAKNVNEHIPLNWQIWKI